MHTWACLSQVLSICSSHSFQLEPGSTQHWGWNLWAPPPIYISSFLCCFFKLLCAHQAWALVCPPFPRAVWIAWMCPLGRIGVGVLWGTPWLRSGNDLGGKFLHCCVQPPRHLCWQRCCSRGLCQGHLGGLGCSHDGLLRVGGEDGPRECDNDGWWVDNHPGVTAGHHAGLVAAGGQGLGTLCLAGVGACQLVGSHRLAVAGECLQFVCRIKKKQKKGKKKKATMHLVIATCKLGCKRSLDRDKSNKDSSWTPLLVSAPFYLASTHLSFWICCFKLALFPFLPLGAKILPVVCLL